MKKIHRSFIFVAFVVLANISFAQLKPVCGTDEMVKKSLLEHPEFAAAHQALDLHTQEFTQSHTASPDAGTLYIIPIVFHIIHNYGPENISDEQVKDQVRILNEDYRKLNADISQVVPTFAGITADIEIEFRLPTKDPNGNCTNGIDRQVSTQTFVGDDGSKLNPWPNNKYLNVWVVNNVGQSSGGTYTVGYSYFPGTTSNATDGIIFRSDFIGSIGTGRYNHDLSHEVGHFLNLYHVWGNSNSPGVACGDDQVSDTPETIGSAFDCNLSLAGCNPPSIENVQNIMDYSACAKMFTEGQKTRMRIAATSATASRNNLWSATNLTATGVNITPAPSCTPKADFISNYTLACIGSHIQYTDLSWNGNPTSWNWAFSGGSPAVSSDSMPVVTYSTAGTFPVTLTSANGAGSNSVTKTSYITVMDTSSKYYSPTHEGFEAATYPNSDWKIVNPDNGPTWKKTTTAKASGLSCMMVSNFSGSVADEVETLISPLYDFSSSSSHKLTFKLAYAPKSTSSSDRLQISLSTDCGATWSVRYNKTSSALSTAGIKTSSFVPTLSSQWKTEEVSIDPYSNRSLVRIKIEFTSGGNGNNIYIDDININYISGTETHDPELINAELFPNPFDGESMLQLTLPETMKCTYSVNDILGREYFRSSEQFLSAGSHEIPLSVNAPSGIYFLNIQAGDKMISRKVVIAK